jgi:hypothetical protein
VAVVVRAQLSGQRCPRVRVNIADLVLVAGVATEAARSRSSTTAKMLRLRDARGSRGLRCPSTPHDRRQGEPLLEGIDLPALGYRVKEHVSTEAAMHLVVGR